MFKKSECIPRKHWNNITTTVLHSTSALSKNVSPVFVKLADLTDRLEVLFLVLNAYRSIFLARKN